MPKGRPALDADLPALADLSTRLGSIGAALLEEVEAWAWARARGCAALRVRSNVVRERAHRFYRRAGFETIKTQHVFEKRIG